MKRDMTNREKRLIRFGAIGVGIYLVLFFVWKPLQHRRSDYEQLVQDARLLKQKIQPYNDRADAVKKLMDTFQMDPAKLSRATVVGEASAAIQKAAAGSGIQIGPVRESPARASGKELASVQVEGTGPVPAVMALIKRLETLGYPLVIDSIQLTQQSNPPGQVKMNLTILILDFEQWKKEGQPDA